jgi:ferritin-like metal-binding protein YciE
MGCHNALSRAQASNRPAKTMFPADLRRGWNNEERLLFGVRRSKDRLNSPTPAKGVRVMGFFSKDIKSMEDLFVHTLRDIYYAENQIEKSLPKMIDKAGNAELRSGLEHHLAETRGHIERLEKVFELHGSKASGVTCPAIDGILKEADEIVGEVADQDVLDAAIVAAGQAVEHYEITRYGTLVAWAKELGHTDCVDLLRKNLEEEKAADSKLSKLAENRVNRMAA